MRVRVRYGLYSTIITVAQGVVGLLGRALLCCNLHLFNEIRHREWFKTIEPGVEAQLCEGPIY